MGNSKLISYTKISPNRTSPRNHAIDTISIHCVAGQCSVETLGSIFSGNRQVSCNYGIGPDGRIGLYCEEKDRSWCTSSRENDHRAITVEVASDSKAPFAVRDAAYKALIDLLADVCQRNGIKRLVWSWDKKERLAHANGCNMTVHMDFANKDCPGKFLYDRQGEIAEKVNAKLGAVLPPAPTQTVKPSQTVRPAKVDTTGKDIWDYLTGKGLPPFAAAGILGNLYAESGLNPKNLQNNGNKTLGMTDEEYTAAVDAGQYDNYVRDGYGHGLAQWTYWSRKEALLNFAKAAGKSIGDLTVQLDFLWTEMQGYKKMMEALREAKTVREASDIFLLNFERPADQGEAVQVKRAGFGQTYYERFAGFPYKVKVTATALNVRTGPGEAYDIATAIRDQGVYTIMEVQNGFGRLKSGAGWISMKYTERRD